MANMNDSPDANSEHLADAEVFVLGGMDSSESGHFQRRLVEEKGLEAARLAQQTLLGQQTVESMAVAVAVPPPSSLRTTTLRRILGELWNGYALTALQAKLRRVSLYAAAASVVGVVGVGAAWRFYGLEKSAEMRVSIAEKRLHELESEHMVFASKAAAFDRRQLLLSDAATTLVFMNSAAPSGNNIPSPRSAVYWHSQTHAVYLEALALASIPENKDYQLWAMADGKPHDLGVFHPSMDSKELLRMKDIHSAEAFAITLEPKGGLPTPTLSQLVVIGNVAKL